MDLWTRSYLPPLPAKNLSRECERFDGWRGAIMCGKFAPRKSPENFSNRSKSGSEEIYEANPGGSFPTPFFLFPLFSLLPSPPPRPYRPLVSSAGSAGLFIFAVSKRVTDDGTMLIIPSMWEPIVARSYRGREWQRPGFSRPRFLWYLIILKRIDLEKNPLLVEDIYIYIYTCPYGEGTELNGGTESS